MQKLYLKIQKLKKTHKDNQKIIFNLIKSLDENFKIYYFEYNNLTKYYFIVSINNEVISLDFPNNILKSATLEEVFIAIKNKIILSLKTYKATDKLILYEYLPDNIRRKIDYTKNIDNLNYSLLQKTHQGLLLTEEEMYLLNSYNIDFTKFSSLDNLLQELDDILNVEPDLTDLEYLYQKLEERKYYEEVNK